MKAYLYATGLAVCLAAGPLLADPAQATTVTFDNGMGNWTLEQPSSTFNDSGLTFTNNGSQMYVWGGDSPNSNGTNNLIFGFGLNDTLVITRTGGGVFDLASLDLATSWYTGTPNQTITVNGSPLAITDTLTTYALNLTGLSQLAISGLPSGDGYWTADNIVFNVAAVPEPATWVMMLVGFAGLGFVARRKWAAAAQPA